MPWTPLYDYWFAQPEASQEYLESRFQLWFRKNPEADQYIRENFAPLLQEFSPDKCESWKASPQGWLSLIILLDQVPRNSFRASPKSFAFDSYALALCKEGLGQVDTELSTLETLFFYLPLEHSEALVDQELSLKMFEARVSSAKNDFFRNYAKENLQYAKAHYDVIARFGRFPHRNEILGRKSTPEEIEFLKQPGSSF